MFYALLNNLDAWSEANPGTLLVLGVILTGLIFAGLAIWAEMGQKQKEDK